MEEVGVLTPSMFAALCKQRRQEFRRQVWLQNLVVAAVYNVQRTESSQHYFTPWDFIPDPNANPEQDEIVRTLRAILHEQPTKEDGSRFVWTPEEVAKFKKLWVAKLTDKGRADVEVIMERVFRGLEI